MNLNKIYIYRILFLWIMVPKLLKSNWLRLFENQLVEIDHLFKINMVNNQIKFDLFCCDTYKIYKLNENGI